MGIIASSSLRSIVTGVVFFAAVSACTGQGSTGAGRPKSEPSATTTSALPDLVDTSTWSTSTVGILELPHPRTWRTADYPWAGSFTSLITYLSPQQLHDPRITKRLPNGNTEFTVGEPLRHLPATGLLVTWTQTGFPHPSGADLLGSAGVHLTVDGYPARLLQGAPDPSCAALGGKQLVRGTFLLREVIEMRACLASDDEAAAAVAITTFRLTKVTVAAKAALRH